MSWKATLSSFTRCSCLTQRQQAVFQSLTLLFVSQSQLSWHIQLFEKKKGFSKKVSRFPVQRKAFFFHIFRCNKFSHYWYIMISKALLPCAAIKQFSPATNTENDAQTRPSRSFVCSSDSLTGHNPSTPSCVISWLLTFGLGGSITL